MSTTSSTLPKHVAIIMDGNGRWAQNRGLPRAAGHQAGFQATRDIVEACAQRKIEALTLFAFSSENWARPKQEVGLLMDLFLRGLRSEVSKLNDNNVCITFIGERSAFSDKLENEMSVAESATVNNTGLQLNIAVNYGGRWDIVEAARKLAHQVKQGELEPEDISIDNFSKSVTLAHLSDPDLFIRTGGEKRISNYLLWHLAYTELYFVNVLYPDFNDADLEQALKFYAGRQRRFGKTGEQVTNNHA